MNKDHIMQHRTTHKLDNASIRIGRIASICLLILGIFEARCTEWTHTVLYDFAGGATSGAWPAAGLTQLDDKLYGTTYNGGESDQGTIYSVDPITGSVVLLHSFTGDEGVNPGILTKYNGKLYGTTWNGGPYGGGTLFSYDPLTSTFSLLSTFDNDANGAQPSGLLVFNDLLYGVTANGGQYGGGTLFSY